MRMLPGHRRTDCRSTAVVERNFPTVFPVAVLLWAAVVASAAPAAAAISDCIDATCRITEPGGGRGTGCVFEIGQDRVYVLTAAHVVGKSQQVECDFWRAGHQSRPLIGQVVSRDEQADAAIVALGRGAFGAMLPPAIPVAHRGFLLRPGDAILSVGCAGGSWSTGFRGHVLGYQGMDLHFVPGPANGRSGSAIFDAAGEQIVGVLRARSIDDSRGIATSVQGLYRAFGVSGSASGKAPSAAAANSTQCPGGNCPVPPHLFPYRREMDQRLRKLEGQPPQASPWPTLPSPTAAPQVDLHPIEEKLDHNAEMMRQGLERIAGLLEERVPAPTRPPSASQPPTEAPDEAPDLKATVAADVEAVRRQVHTTQEDNSRLHQAVAGLRGLVERAVGDRETLRERMEARIEKVQAELGDNAGKPEVIRAYVRDLLAEKLGDPGLGMSAGKMVGTALGLSAPLALALAAAAWLISRRVGSKLESGEPLLAQRLFDRIGDKLDDLKDRLRDPSGGSASGL